MCEFCVRVLCTIYICEFYVWLLWANSVCELCERVLCVSSMCVLCVSSLWVLCVSSMCEFCVRVLCTSSICEFYVWLLWENSVWIMWASSMCEFFVCSMCEFLVSSVWVLCASSVCEFYVRVLFVSSMCDFCERTLCELCERVLCVSSMCVLCMSSGANQTSSTKNKLGANWGQPDKFAEAKLLGTTEDHGSASSVCELCLQVQLADKLGDNWGQPGKFAERTFWGDHGRPWERRFCVQGLPQTNWEPTEANQASSPKEFFGGTTGDHESASSVCEPCLRVLLAARRRAHKSIAAQVCVSKRPCGPTSAPEAQNRPQLISWRKAAGAHGGPDGRLKFATTRGDKGQWTLSASAVWGTTKQRQRQNIARNNKKLKISKNNKNINKTKTKQPNTKRWKQNNITKNIKNTITTTRTTKQT